MIVSQENPYHSSLPRLALALEIAACGSGLHGFPTENPVGNPAPSQLDLRNNAKRTRSGTRCIDHDISRYGALGSDLYLTIVAAAATSRVSGLHS
jgi:hypothetical protein